MSLTGVTRGHGARVHNDGDSLEDRSITLCGLPVSEAAGWVKLPIVTVPPEERCRSCWPPLPTPEPPSTRTADEQALDELIDSEPELVYGTRTGDAYHRGDCAVVQDLRVRVTEWSRGFAKYGLDLRPCARCKPDEPST